MRALDAGALPGVFLSEGGSCGSRGSSWHSRLLFILFLLTLPFSESLGSRDGIGYYSYLARRTD